MMRAEWDWRLWQAVAALLAMALFALVGCGGVGSKVGAVSGTVTLGEQPLPDAIVTFSPQKGGSPSSGRTDGSGKYVLRYTRETEGAEIGEHSVTITTASEGEPDAEPPVPATPEKVPARYNLKTELKATVNRGSNTIDFPLESGGEIAKPA